MGDINAQNAVAGDSSERVGGICHAIIRKSYTKRLSSSQGKLCLLPEVKELYLPQIGAPPRLYFSHGTPEQSPIVNFTIYIQRNPASIVMSWYWFLSQYLAQENMPSVEELYFNCVRKHCAWPQDALSVHVAQWRRASLHRNVLWLRFEDFKERNGKTLEKLVAKIQRFLMPIPGMGRNTSDMMDKLSYRFFQDNPHITDMHTHINNFDQVWYRCGERFGLPNGRPYHGIRTSHQLNRTAEMPTSVIQHLDRAWKRIVQPVIGYKSYKQFLDEC